MTLKKIFFYLILFFSYAGEATDSTELLFFKKGTALKTMNLEALKKSHKDEILKVFEPHENSQKEYRGFLMLPLLDSVYGKNQSPSLDTVVFYCTDGYRSDIPLEELKA